MKTYIIIKDIGKDPYIKKVEMSSINLQNSKSIAKTIIGCKFVDGISLYRDSKYIGGVYCDDLAMSKYEYNCNIENSRAYGRIVFINEFKRINRFNAMKILKIFKEVISYV